MNQKNTIKSMIPQRLLDLVPFSVREDWANRIVEKVQEISPSLFAAMGQWTVVPEEERRNVVNVILVAAEEVHWEIRDES